MIVCGACGEELDIKVWDNDDEKVVVEAHNCPEAEEEHSCEYCGKSFDSQPAMYGHQTTCDERKKD